MQVAFINERLEIVTRKATESDSDLEKYKEFLLDTKPVAFYDSSIIRSKLIKYIDKPNVNDEIIVIEKNNVSREGMLIKYEEINKIRKINKDNVAAALVTPMLTDEEELKEILKILENNWNYEKYLDQLCAYYLGLTEKELKETYNMYYLFMRTFLTHIEVTSSQDLINTFVFEMDNNIFTLRYQVYGIKSSNTIERTIYNCILIGDYNKHGFITEKILKNVKEDFDMSNQIWFARFRKFPERIKFKLYPLNYVSNSKFLYDETYIDIVNDEEKRGQIHVTDPILVFTKVNKGDTIKIINTRLETSLIREVK